MKKIKLGSSQLETARLSLGCWSFGGGAYWGEQSQASVNETVDCALDLGITLFDTAEMYNNGDSERSLGAALRGKRDKALICSKISPSNCKDIRAHLEASLQRLGTDYLDIYMLHWPINEYGLRHFSSDPELLRNPPTIENAYSTLAELKKEGLIRCIGVSNFGTTQMQEVLRTGVALDVNEMPYNIVSRAIEVDIAPFCEENNISLLGSMALQQGLLAGKYHCAQEVPAFQAHSRHFSSIRGGEASRHTEEGAENEIFAVVRRITELAEELRITPAELSIAWILSKPFMSSILVGCRTRQQLETNIKACETVLPPHVIAEIDRISLPVLEKLGPSPDYYEDRENSRIY